MSSSSKSSYADIIIEKSANLRESLQRIAERAKSLLKPDLVEFYEYDESRKADNKFVLPPVFAGKKLQPTDIFRTIHADDAFLKLIEGDAVYEENVQDEAGFITPYKNQNIERFVIRENIRSTAILPLTVGPEKVGLMFVNYRTLQHFRKDRQERIKTFADHAAITIKDARLYAIDQRRQLLIETGRKLTSGIRLHEEQIVQLIYEQASHVLGIKNLTIALYEAASETVRFVLASREGELIDIQKQIGWEARQKAHGKTEKIIHDKVPLLLPTIKEVREAGFTPIPGDKTHKGKMANAWLGVPMLIGDNVLGVITTFLYGDDQFFTQDDIEILQALADQAAIALDNARLFASEQQQRQRAELLQNVAHIVSSTLDPTELSELALTQLQNVLTYDSASIQIFEGIHRRLLGYRGPIVQTMSNELLRDVTGDPLLQKIIQTRRPILLSDVTTCPDWKAVPATSHVKSWIGVPMIFQGRIIGLLTIDHTHSGYYTETSQELALTFADLVAPALSHATSFQNIQSQLDQRMSDLTLFEDVYASLGKGSLENVLTLLLERSVQVTAADYADVWFYDPEKHELSFDVEFQEKRQTAIYRQGIQRLSLEEGKGIVTHVAVTRRAYLCHDVFHDAYYFGLNPDVRSEIAVPLIYEEQLIGVLNFESTKTWAFTIEHQKLLEALAGQAAVAIHNARLTQRLTDLNQRQKVLIELGQDLAATIQLTEEQILEAIYNNASKLMHTDNMYIAICDEEAKLIRFGLVYEQGQLVDVANEPKWKPRKANEGGKTEVVIAEKKPLLLRTNAESEAWYKHPDHKQHYGTKIEPSWLGVPMICQGRVLGVIATHHDGKEYAYSSDDANILWSMANEAAIALENARLYGYTEQKQKALIAIGQVLTAEIQRPVPEILQTIYQNASQLLDTENMYIALYNRQADEVQFPIAYRAGKPWKVAPRISGNGRTEGIIRSGKPILTKTMEESQAWSVQIGGEGLAGPPFASFVGVPMIVGDEIVGVIATFHFTKEYVYDEEDLRILQAMANQAAIAIENARLYEERRQSEQQLKKILDVLPTATFVLDHEQKVTYWNKAIEAMTGTQAIDIIGKRNYEYGKAFYGNRRPILIDLLQHNHPEVAQEYSNLKWYGDILEAETHIKEKSKYVQARAALLHGAEGNVVGAIETITDITERKHVEDQLQALNAKDKVLIELGQTVAASIQLTEQEILYSIYVNASELMDTANMFIALYDHSTDLVRFPLLFLNGVPFSIPARKMSSGKGLTEEIIRTRKPLLFAKREEIIDWYARPEHIEYTGTGTDADASWVGVPMLQGEKVLGIIATYHATQEHLYSSSDLEILQAMANLSAIALENARLYQALRKIKDQQTVLRDLGQKFASKINMDEAEFIQIVYDAASQLINTDNLYIQLYDENTNTVRVPLAFRNRKPLYIAPYSPGKGVFEETITSIRAVVDAHEGEIIPWQEHLDGREDVALPWIGALMTSGDKILGVIATYNAKDALTYSGKDLELLQAIANSSAIALENARLYAEMEQRSKMLADLNVALEKANQQIADTQDLITREMMSADFVHKVNNLAGTIPVWSDVIRETIKKQPIPVARVNDCLDKIDGDVHGLLGAADLLNKTSLEYKFDLAAMLQNILRQMQFQQSTVIQAGQLTIHHQIPDNLYHIRGTASVFSNVLYSIFSNGIEAILAKGSGELTINTRNSQHEQGIEGVIIEVTDTGIGISIEHREKLFTPFFSTKGTGRGYGLWRAKNIIEQRMHGSIQAIFDWRGTTFRIFLPRAQEE